MASLSAPKTPDYTAETGEKHREVEEGGYAGLQARLGEMEAERARLDARILILREALNIVKSPRADP
jgi:hypothetical protein